MVVAVSCSAITIKTLVGYTDMRLITKVLISLLVVVSWFAPVLVRGVRDSNLFSNEAFSMISNVGYFLFGLAFILFCVLILRDLLWYVIDGIARLLGHIIWSINPKNISVLDRANVVTVLFSIALAFYAYFEATKLPNTKEVDFVSSKLKQDITLVHLSDLHFSRTTDVKKVDNLVTKVNGLNPDVILITGDIVDDDVPHLENHMKSLQKLQAKYGVFVSNGNHEFYSGINSWSKEFKNLGFNFLFNQGKNIPELNLFVAGIPDMTTAGARESLKINFDRTLKNSSISEYKLLMSHHPQVIDYVTKVGFDLQLSGHTHGGQIYPFHWLAKKANKYLAGKYQVNGVDLYVSRGTGYWGPPMRLFAPSEIALIKLKAQK